MQHYCDRDPCPDALAPARSVCLGLMLGVVPWGVIFGVVWLIGRLL